MDIPGTASQFYIFAIFTRDEPVEKIVVGEGVMIGSCGLYEDEKYYKALCDLGVPVALQGLHHPIQGLNKDAGLKYAFRSNDKDEKPTEAKDVTPQDAARYKKLSELISIGITAKVYKLHQREWGFKMLTIEVYLPKRELHDYPKIAGQNITVFLDLSHNVKHAHPFIDYEPSYPQLQHFGLWIMMDDDRTGFWAQRRIADLPIKGPKRTRCQRLWEELAEYLVQHYALQQSRIIGV
ncbi:hypothetical protein LTS08_006280 [Lithohypha guttulata]|nr:hypothetical protein LTS08_006280 [Lithohypha guttulata]